MNLFVATTPVERFGWQMVSLVPKGAGNAAVSQQTVITNELVWRLAILAGIIITFVLLLERNASRKLRRQQEDYRTIIASISGGVLKFFSPDGTFLFVSPNYKKMLGFTEAEFNKIYGNSFAATIYEKDRDPALRTMAVRLLSDRLEVLIHSCGKPASSRSKYSGTTAFSSREYSDSASA